MNVAANVTIMTSREFNQDRAKAKRAARLGPVFITDRGKPEFVMMSKAEFDRIKAEEKTSDAESRLMSLREALADNRPEAVFDWSLRV